MTKSLVTEKTDKDDSGSLMINEAWSPRRFFDWLSWPGFGPRFEAMGFFDEHFMRTEEFETDDAFVVRAEIPGLDPERDVDVHVDGHTLHIEAHRKEEHEAEEQGRYRSEFRYGQYVRTLTVPDGVHADDVKATYKNGILEVRMPRDHDKAVPTKVPVQQV
jgi:HSP20 family protein